MSRNSVFEGGLGWIEWVLSVILLSIICDIINYPTILSIFTYSSRIYIHIHQEFIIPLPMNYELVDKQYTYKEQDPAYMG